MDPLVCKDVLYTIASFLSVQDILRMQRVCRYWNAAMCANLLWHSICIRDHRKWTVFREDKDYRRVYQRLHRRDIQVPESLLLYVRKESFPPQHDCIHNLHDSKDRALCATFRVYSPHTISVPLSRWIQYLSSRNYVATLHPSCVLPNAHCINHTVHCLRCNSLGDIIHKKKRLWVWTSIPW